MAWYISVHMIQESAAFEQYLVAREGEKTCKTMLKLGLKQAKPSSSETTSPVTAGHHREWVSCFLCLHVVFQFQLVFSLITKSVTDIGQ